MTDQPNKSVLKMAVAAISKQLGFDDADQIAIENVTEMLQSYITEVGKSSKLMSELAGRTEIIPTDVTLALVEMGFNVNSLIPFLQRRETGRIIIAPPRSTPPANEAKTLRVGNVKPHPTHIPDYLPQFPDPHTYVQTPTQIEFNSDYETARLMCATQQRNVESSLVKFMRDIDSSSVLKLYVDDCEFKVILPSQEPKAYLSALLPPDEELSDIAGDDEESAVLKNLDNPFLRPVKMPRTMEMS